MENVWNYIERFGASWKYVNAIHDLPPTYDAAGANFHQFIPDHASASNIRVKMDYVDKCEQNLKDVVARQQAAKKKK